MLGLSFETSSQPARNEEWRVLRLLSLYRLMLVAALLFIFESDYADQLFPAIRNEAFRSTCILYGVSSLVLMGLLPRRQPALAAQAQLQVAIDIAALALLLLTCGGISTGLGALLITPVVAAALVMSRRMAMLQAAIGTLAVFGVEILRGFEHQTQSSDFTASGVLGLMLFGASLAANAVAQRARLSEALVEQVGSEFESLSELNESIVASMQSGVLVIDDDGYIRSYNAAAAHLLGFTDDLHGARLEAHAKPIAERLQHWRENGHADDAPLSLHADADEIIPRISRLGRHYDGHGAALIMLDDAARLREQAQQMKLAALGRLSANIAHEIRNPLSAIHHATELLAESDVFTRDDHAQDKRLLDMIRRHSERIEKIVRDVLAMSRREPPHPQTLELKACLVRFAGHYQEGFPDQPRPIELLDMPSTLTVRFDPDHLQQILFNLWNNAFSHGAHESAAVMVLLEAGVDEHGKPWLEISDNGSGIPDALRERMFEPFFTTAHQGTGLGLFLTRELCEYNQARIAYRGAESPNEVVGARFRISFASPLPA